MSISDWVKTNIVQPVIDELLKPENLTKITEALTAELGAQGDRIIAEVTGHSAATAQTVITEVNTATDAVSKDLADNINNLGVTIVGEINSVVSGLLANIKNLIPHIPGLAEPPPRPPRGRR